MESIVFNYKKKNISKNIYPDFTLKKDSIIVNTAYSAVSTGTEKNIKSVTSQNLIKIAITRPDLLKRVLSKIKNEGVFNTYKQIDARLNLSKLLGYSASGIVIKSNSKKFKINDKVVIIGDGEASHSSKNITHTSNAIKLPSKIDLQTGSLVGILCIVINAIKISKLEENDTVLIYGLGFLGLLACSVLNSMGFKNIYGLDKSFSREQIAQKEFGITIIDEKDYEFFHYFKKILIFGSSKSDELITNSVNFISDYGKITCVGLTSLSFSRDDFFNKKIEFEVASGFAKYNTNLNNNNLRQNVKDIFDLILKKKLNLKIFKKNILKFDEAEFFYKNIDNSFYLNTIFKYKPNKFINSEYIKNHEVDQKTSFNKIKISFFGSGLFAKSSLLPALARIKKIFFYSIHSNSVADTNELYKKYKFLYFYTDQLIIDESDAIICATKHQNHFDTIRKSFLKNKSIFCEKPIVTNLVELNNLLKIYKDNLVFYTGYNRRFSKFANYIKRFIHNNQLVINEIFIQLNPSILPKNHWIYENDQGQGRIVSELCHFIDLSNFFHDDFVLSCSKFNQKFSNQHHTDNFQMKLNYPKSKKTLIHLEEKFKSETKEYIKLKSNDYIIEIFDFKILKIQKNKKLVVKKNLYRSDLGHNQILKSFFNDLGHKNIDKNFIMSIFNSTEVVLRLNKEGNIFTKIKLNKNELYKRLF